MDAGLCSDESPIAGSPVIALGIANGANHLSWDDIRCASERKKVYEWLAKLSDLGDELPEAKIRNEYISYLLINVQNGRLIAPFNLVPPCGKLRPLSRILPEHLYDDALKQFKANYCFVKNQQECECIPGPPAPPSVAPANFQKEQPCPSNGIIAYCSAFSSFEE